MRELQDKIQEKLLEKRVINFHKPVMSDSVNEAIDKLLYLHFLDAERPILLLVNSPGGSVTDGFALIDLMSSLSNRVYTAVYGLAASMGSILSLAGGSGGRFIFPNARVMIHQPRMSGAQGQVSDLQITAEEILKTRDLIVDMYVKYTDKSPDKIREVIERDRWFNATEACAFGLTDRVVSSLSELLQLTHLS